ncbi:class II aldolase/adducin family protein [Patescibacteria group bacterium]|nr:class II aldolase/adducin family protein [Patescibacteria group bacterium]
MKIHIIGGGTFTHVRSHLALAAPAFGETAKHISELFNADKRILDRGFEVCLHLTRMAGGSKDAPVTNEDVADLVNELVQDSDTRIIIFSVALADYQGHIDDVPSGKYAKRLQTRVEQEVHMVLTPTDKIIGTIRKNRKDIFLVGFKTTTGETSDVQYQRGLSLLKSNSCNLVLANDTQTRNNMIISPEESRLMEDVDRSKVLENLVDIVLHRTNLHFSSTKMVDADPIPWNSHLVSKNFREVVDHCIANKAYQALNNKTAGHFCIRTGENEFLSSQRKVNHNETSKNGLVRLTVNEQGEITCYGRNKPSAGATSQWQLLKDYPEAQYIVHFHCPLKQSASDSINIQSQREFECGSLECGINTSNGIKKFGDGIWAVMLDNHGPNILWNDSVRSADVISFIERNFKLGEKVGGNVS